METLTGLPLLDADECAKVVRQVDALKVQWIRRSPALPYFTLGAASYLDAVQDPLLYTQRAARYNAILEASFGWLYDKVLRALITRFDAPFLHAPEAARPGFHIFCFHEAFKKPTASIHFDRQHEDIPWKDPRELEFDSPLSFTLPVCLPACGGGLNTWDASWQDFQGSPFFIPEMIAKSRGSNYIPYTEGVMMVHSGNLLHQIAAAEEIRPEDRRITLQGHALPRKGVYRIYW